MSKSNPNTLRAGRWTALTCLAAALVCLSISGVGRAEDTAESIDLAREQLQKWVETRNNISKEKKEHKLAVEMLNERTALIQEQIDETHEKIESDKTKLADTDKTFNDKTAEDQKLKAGSDYLKQQIVSMEQQTRDLVKRLPTPLQDQVKVLSQQLPEDSANTEIPLSRRYQNVIGILNEINKFNRQITVIEHRITNAAGENPSATVMYIGLGKAFYVYGADREFAGYGTPSDNGWVWHEANDLAPKIVLAHDIYSNKEVPAFVELPLEVK